MISETKTDDKQKLCLELAVPLERSTDDQVAGWLDLLIEGILQVYGRRFFTLLWLRNGRQILARSKAKLTDEKLLAGVESFRRTLETEYLCAVPVPVVISRNGIIVKERRPKASRFHASDLIIVTLKMNGEELGFLGMCPFQDQSEPADLLFSVFEHQADLESVLRLVWTQVAQERNRLQLILNGMFDGVLLLNEKGDILFANDQARHFLGIDEVTSLKVQNLQEARNLDITTFLEETVVNRYETLNKIVKVDSLQKILGVHIQRLRQPSLGWMAILRDITSDWEMDRLRKEFVAQITHELNSPLTVISEGIALVLEEKTGPVSPDQRRCLEYAQDNVQRMGRLVNNLLRITRLEIADDELERRKLVCLKRILNKQLEGFRLRFETKQLQVKTILPDATVQIRIDRDQITQVFVNLLENAIKYTPEGGTITIGIKQEFDQITCWVEDSGLGIPEKEQEKIFQKFYRIDHEVNQDIPGNGLGLAIVREIIEKNGGKIWVESKPGKGSRFIFILPISDEVISGEPKNEKS